MKLDRSIYIYIYRGGQKVAGVHPCSNVGSERHAVEVEAGERFGSSRINHVLIAWEQI